MVFGFFKKKEAEPEDDDDIEPVSFLGPTNGQEVNLKAHAKLVEAGLVRAFAQALAAEPVWPQPVPTSELAGSRAPLPGTCSG